MENCFFGGGTILLPQCDLTRFATIACDQYTSEPAYWAETEAIAAGVPSALHMVLPEVYLPEGEESVSARIECIGQTMRNYLEEGLFAEYPDACVLVERRLRDGRTRYGLLGLIDLEQYDYHAEAGSYIRATEETVLSRIPARVRIRQGAPLEMPHLMLLADDREHELIEVIAAGRENLTKLYDFDLMHESGHLTGYLLDEAAMELVRGCMAKWSDPDYFRRKYRSTAHPLVLAVGDGNHSLAAAKECYEQVKAAIGPERAAIHPARYALAELVNIHDPALDFEPIYRLIRGAELDDLLNYLRAKEPAFHGGMSRQGEISLYFQSELERRTLSIPAEAGLLPVQILQPLLDAYLAEHPEVSIDYIHGLETVRSLGREPGCIAISFNGIAKEQLFGAIVHGGVLPRKTFSMGHAEDKRFYLECRKVVE
ncbi:MAG: DUF1015 domain-containing protein [Firmicutes bacterium]|nr:DUF1015 domain-containing protein [Bacillota bacterium]